MKASRADADISIAAKSCGYNSQHWQDLLSGDALGLVMRQTLQ